jgi:alpha-beta hydrolase superfamily lysophospholipase
MGRSRITVATVTLATILPLTGCTGDPAGPAPATVSPTTVVAEHARYPVGLRELRLARGDDRPLRTVLLYPAAGADSGRIRTNAVPAAGKFPLVLFSHGLRGSPERYVPAAASWTAAGFVVALPAYPHTGKGAADFRRADIENQPEDAAYVISKVRDLARKHGDPLDGRIDGNRVAAIGHSAGGYTTTGLFTAGHDHRLRAGVILAGWLAPGAFRGPPATMLFMQGDADPVVPIARGRAAYAKAPWPKSYVLLHGSFHAEYMLPGHRGHAEMDSIVTDFLRWTLTGDEAAHRRLPPSAFPVDESS